MDGRYYQINLKDASYGRINNYIFWSVYQIKFGKQDDFQFHRYYGFLKNFSQIYYPEPNVDASKIQWDSVSVIDTSKVKWDSFIVKPDSPIYNLKGLKKKKK